MIIQESRDVILKYIGDIAKLYNEDYENNKSAFKSSVADLVAIHKLLDPLIKKYKEYEIIQGDK